MKRTVFFGYLMGGIMILSPVMSFFIDMSNYILYVKMAAVVSGLAAFLSLIFSDKKEQPPH